MVSRSSEPPMRASCRLTSACSAPGWRLPHGADGVVAGLSGHCGEGGFYWRDDGATGTYPTVPVPGPVKDAYGCADSFAAGLTWALGRQLPLQQAFEVPGRLLQTGRRPRPDPSGATLCALCARRSTAQSPLSQPASRGLGVCSPAGPPTPGTTRRKRSRTLFPPRECEGRAPPGESPRPPPAAWRAG